ncbi:Torsin-1A [Fasciolopsis buskii]|uniref:Torsin-1A n=1 Tax=Fasciolopsis buskii TaxID=27845 RepID=A0A8E0VQF3_9TREM|nr:Torsin-1A [Fasciolopsis buski]
MRFHSLLLFLSLVLYSVILLKITLSALFVSAAPEASNLTKRVGSFTPSCQLLALNHSLNTELHGQHIATERVFRHISAHLRDPHPQKPLALSFHGYTGVGKNFVSNLIAASLFGMGTKSNFFHFYDATIHFAHRSKIDEYKKNLYEDLRKAVRSCPVSLFVFDEMHHMPDGILDILAPVLEIRESVDGIDFRKSVFLFLSNTGGNYINRRLYDHLTSGKRREELFYTDVDRFLTRTAFKDEGEFLSLMSNCGLQYSELIQKHLITAMIPFLPLQEEHVKECIRDVAQQRQIPYTDSLVQFVLQELEWAPEGTQMFSVSGCKRVYEKVGLYMEMY